MLAYSWITSGWWSKRTTGPRNDSYAVGLKTKKSSAVASVLYYVTPQGGLPSREDSPQGGRKCTILYYHRTGGIPRQGEKVCGCRSDKAARDPIGIPAPRTH